MDARNIRNRGIVGTLNNTINFKTYHGVKTNTSNAVQLCEKGISILRVVGWGGLSVQGGVRRCASNVSIGRAA